MALPGIIEVAVCIPVYDDEAVFRRSISTIIVAFKL